MRLGISITSCDIGEYGRWAYEKRKVMNKSVKRIVLKKPKMFEKL